MKNVDATKYAVYVKGVEIGAHGTRSGLDMRPIGYACNVQAEDHTSSVYDGYEDMQSIFTDSAVVCSFTRNRTLIWDFYNAITGFQLTKDLWCTEYGVRINHIQRVALLIGGPDIIWKTEEYDENPSRYYEPLPTDPYQGKTTDRTVVETMKKQYYEVVG